MSKWPLFLLSTSWTWCIWVSVSIAAEKQQQNLLPVGKANWYYSLGGAMPMLNFSDGAQVNRFDLLGGEAKWNLDACNFDFKKSISAYLNDPRRNLYALERNILASAKSLLRVSALSAIQRANPGLYDVLTRGIASAHISFETAVKSCEKIRSDLAANNNPLHGWLRLAAHARWTAPHRNVDPSEINADNKTDPGSGGVPWVGGAYAGGEGQKPIAITADVIRAGYQALFGEESERSVIPWSSIDEAIKWVREVLGETELSFCAKCKGMKAYAGHGLQAELTRGQKHYSNLLRALTLSNKRPTSDEISALSTNRMGVGINVAVLQALKNEAPANRDILINRLAHEIALSDALEKSLVTRQLLYTGATEPNVASNGEAQALITKMRERLRAEMDNVLFEHRVRREVLTGTAQWLLTRSNQPLTLPDNSKRLDIRSGLRSVVESIP